MIITLNHWYQLDIKLPDALKARETLLKIDKIISALNSKELVTNWFFLYERDTLRIRMQSPNKAELKNLLDILLSKEGLATSEKLPFSEYQETNEMMPDESFVESFAKIMSEITKLTITKLKKDSALDNYRALERLQHCMFNNLATLSFKNEEHFLEQRLKERLGQVFDNDFENKI